MARIKRNGDRFLKLFGENIRNTRRSRHLTLAEVSEAMDVPIYILKKLEAGEFPNMELSPLIRMALYYQVSMSELFTGEYI